MKHKHLFILLMVCLTGCKKLPPAGFWTDFDSPHITDKNSDQGPWGGNRTIYWENKAGIKDTDMLKFAHENEWILLNTRNVIDPAVEMDKWIKYPGKLYIFNSEWTTEVDGKDKIAYGYILISDDHKRMSLYHSWGQ
ncbi:hypothetical protein [Mucilaginibacter pedocola]|uniref:Uncharacterized protein n=1 Tax=Mucilaginibacter pedocola TaxID=1792845 RepID=A0A1S9PMP0_9SPHI|nr:hypothetical protein [Mucilaginibacter pedocola]OOQ62223.1 hypothetical protein BC343_04050 [Mucilaginibacter pedocola]